MKKTLKKTEETIVAEDEQPQAETDARKCLAAAAEVAIKSWHILAPDRAIIQMTPQSRSQLGFIPEMLRFVTAHFFPPFPSLHGIVVI